MKHVVWVARILSYDSCWHEGGKESQAVGDSATVMSPARWLSCGDLDQADVELGHPDDGGNLLPVGAAVQDAGMTSSDPELYHCSSDSTMSVIHTTEPSSIAPPPMTNGVSVLVTSEM